MIITGAVADAAITVGVYVNVSVPVVLDGENMTEALSVMGLFAPTVAVSLTLYVTKTVMKVVPELAVKPKRLALLMPRYHKKNIFIRYAYRVRNNCLSIELEICIPSSNQKHNGRRNPFVLIWKQSASIG